MSGNINKFHDLSNWLKKKKGKENSSVKGRLFPRRNHGDYWDLRQAALSKANMN